MKKIFLIALICLSLASCVSLYKVKISRELAAPGIKTAEQLATFFCSEREDSDTEFVYELARLYIDEASQEGINSDCAFAQMCLETGFLRYGNLVTPEMNNFCGLGAVNKEKRGEIFETPQLGVRAHIQHLHAYATPSSVPLKNPCIDPRYKYVSPRGKSPKIDGLSRTWAADPDYSYKLEQLLLRLEQF